MPSLNQLNLFVISLVQLILACLIPLLTIFQNVETLARGMELRLGKPLISVNIKYHGRLIIAIYYFILYQSTVHSWSVKEMFATPLFIWLTLNCAG